MLFPFKKRSQVTLIFALVLSLFLLLPFLILRQNTYLIIHDNLDGEFVYFHVLKLAGELFSFHSNTIVPNVMNGIPRSCYHSEFSFIRVLYAVFPSFWAYVINALFVRVIGFFGLYLLNRDYLLKEQRYSFQVLIAFIFALIPLYPIYGISVIGQPLLFWSFLNIGQSHNFKVTSWLIVILFPFYAHFALVAPFIISGLLIFGLIRKILPNYNIHANYFIALGVLCLFFGLANFITLKAFIFPGNYVSHRYEFKAASYSLFDVVRHFGNLVLFGQYSSSTFSIVPVYALALIAIYYTRKKGKIVLPILGILASIGLIDGFAAIYPILRKVFEHSLHFILTFQFHRFTFLVPFLWFVMFSLAVAILSKRLNNKIIYAAIFIQFVILVKDNKELKNNYQLLLSSNITTQKIPTFSSFFATSQFDQISNFINSPKKDYRVICVGFHPSVAQYNGFYTLGGYQNNYPLSYKTKFRKVIAPELAKDSVLAHYFDDWGSRCYMFSSELHSGCFMMCTKYCNDRIKDLNINTEALQNLGGKYIISSVPIDNYRQLNLDFLKEFKSKNSLWNIYLYKV